MLYKNIERYEKHISESFSHNLANIYFIIIKDDFERKKVIKDTACYFYETDTFAKSCFSARDCSLQDVFNALESITIFMEKPIVIIDEVELLKKMDVQKLIFYIKNNTLDGFLILAARAKKMVLSLINDIEKRGVVLDLSREKKWEKKQRILKFISKKCAIEKKRISIEAKQKLLENIGLDFSKINMEIDKLIVFAREKQIIEESDVLDVCVFQNEKTAWEIAEKIIWEDPFSVSLKKNMVDSNFFYLLIAALRYQIKIGFSFFENGYKNFYFNKQKKAISLGLNFFEEAKHLLFEIEILSKKNVVCYIALLDNFRAKLKRSYEINFTSKLTK